MRPREEEKISSGEGFEVSGRMTRDVNGGFSFSIVEMSGGMMVLIYNVTLSTFQYCERGTVTNTWPLCYHTDVFVIILSIIHIFMYFLKSQRRDIWLYGFLLLCGIQISIELSEPSNLSKLTVTAART